MSWRSSWSVTWSVSHSLATSSFRLSRAASIRIPASVTRRAERSARGGGARRSAARAVDQDPGERDEAGEALRADGRLATLVVVLQLHLLPAPRRRSQLRRPR